MTVADLLSRQTYARTLVRTRLIDVIGRLWTDLGSWNDADVERFVDRVAPLVQAGQMQTATLTDGYIAQVLSEMTGATVRPLGLSREDVTDLRGVPVAEVYRRPFVEIWTGLKNGQSFADALNIGQDRLLRLVDDDLSLSHRTMTSAAFTQHDHVSRYRRVIRPELARGGTCGLCIAAASQVYRSDNLMAVHSRCHCEVLPILADSDPGATFNDEDIKSVYGRAAAESDGLDAASLKKVRFTVHEHGELGPVLREQGQHFDTAA